MKKTPNKTARINLRVENQLKERGEKLSIQLNKKSFNLFIEELIWKAVLYPEKFFTCCPVCRVPIFDIEEIPISEGIQDLKCDNGHVHQFDFETEKFI